MSELQRVAIALAGSAMLFCASMAPAAEVIGQASHIRTSVTGDGQEMVVRDPVHRDERIRTSRSGLGQFVFRDGTRLAVGWGSSVVIDRFVFDDGNSLKKLTLNTARGTFRWVSGKSKSNAYEIVTPAGTIGVRGTAFDFYVGPDGTTAMVLLNGSASFCGRGGCRQLVRRCDCVIATPGGGMTNVRRVDRSILQQVGNARALPFLSGHQQLAGGFQDGACRLEAAMQPRQERQERPPRQPAPTPPPDKRKKVERPSWDRPDRETRGRDKADFDTPGRVKPDRDRPGFDRPDRERPDRDRPGREPSDRDRPGRDRPDRDRPDRDGGGPGTPARDSPGRDRPDFD
ncbi:FecR domain-containing protein [Rhizobium sp. TRM96647]|uniref:FecR family protein n=1 Tax=unclassified Rhizobium TaxID=2613769 RepID=UPI0021E80605|nr:MULTISPECIES: FecR domain-containing protein [unclassified Rhizobium]MCV3737972.1 FecR domain-containing protein [Rhizobium sp. TRM96647]MCV3759659.1 FecR domain-containing protein [Rhizobium sp. TRM96650]